MPERAKRLHRASVELLGILDLPRLEQALVDAARDIMRADAAALMVPGPDPQWLVIGAHQGLSERYVKSQRIPLAAARALHASLDDHVIIDLSSSGLGDRELAEAEGLRKVLAIPMVKDAEYIGSLNVYTKQPAYVFDGMDIDLVHVLAAEGGVAISNARLFQDAVQQRTLREAVLEALGEGVLIAYPPDRLVFRNGVAEAYTGIALPPEGIPVLEWLARANARAADTGVPIDEESSPLLRGLRGEESHVEMRVRHALSGEERIVEVKGRPVRADGQVVAAVASLHDLTELRKVEEEKEQFLSIVSHELRTPLTPLKALAQLLISRIRRSAEKGVPLDTESLERNLASIERQVDRMNGLVSDLLSVSRAGRGRLELDVRPFDLALSVRDIVERYVQATKEEGRHRFVVDAPAALSVTADQSRVEQLLMNLIGNAVKYSPHGGSVRVALARENGFAEITIADQGIGITAEDLPRLGTPFTRGSGRAASFAGMGIGLHVAKLVAGAHGGSVEIESGGEDRGTTVRVKLPA